VPRAMRRSLRVVRDTRAWMSKQRKKVEVRSVEEMESNALARVPPKLPWRFRTALPPAKML
jgi:hypothetical protein